MSRRGPPSVAREIKLDSGHDAKSVAPHVSGHPAMELFARNRLKRTVAVREFRSRDREFQCVDSAQWCWEKRFRSPALGFAANLSRPMNAQRTQCARLIQRHNHSPSYTKDWPQTPRRAVLASHAHMRTHTRDHAARWPVRANRNPCLRARACTRAGRMPVSFVLRLTLCGGCQSLSLSRSLALSLFPPPLSGSRAGAAAVTAFGGLRLRP